MTELFRELLKKKGGKKNSSERFFERIPGRTGELCANYIDSGAISARISKRFFKEIPKATSDFFFEKISEERFE